MHNLTQVAVHGLAAGTLQFIGRVPKRFSNARFAKALPVLAIFWTCSDAERIEDFINVRASGRFPHEIYLYFKEFRRYNLVSTIPIYLKQKTGGYES
jgi:hypothetical protein